MSAKATFWAWEQETPKASDKFVLLCLANCHNDDTKRCDPSVNYIAAQTGMDRKTVMTSIERLTESQIISPNKRFGTSTSYTLFIDVTSTKNGTSTKTGTSTKNGTRPVPKTGHPPVPKTVPKPKRNLKEPKRAIATKLPDDFCLTEKLQSNAETFWQGKGRNDLDAAEQFEEFRNHHTAHGKKMASWDAAWKTWYGNAVKFNKPKQKHTGGFQC